MLMAIGITWAVVITITATSCLGPAFLLAAVLGALAGGLMGWARRAG